MTAAGPVLCVGAAHWDVIARADAAMPPGADLPGVAARRPGGVALNVAAALVGRGVRAHLLAVVGRDAEGDALLAAAAALGVDVSRTLRAATPTDAYVAIEAAGELVAAVADCRTLEAAGAAVRAALRAARGWRGTVALDGNLPDAALDAVAGEDLFSGELYVTPASPAKAARLARFIAAVRPTVAANRAEAEALCGAAFAAADAAARALVALGARRALVTDGPRPAAFAAHAVCITRAATARAPATVTGAGDAALAALIAADIGGATDPAALLAAALDAAAAHVTAEAS